MIGKILAIGPLLGLSLLTVGAVEAQCGNCNPVTPPERLICTICCLLGFPCNRDILGECFCAQPDGLPLANACQTGFVEKITNDPSLWGAIGQAA